MATSVNGIVMWAVPGQRKLLEAKWPSSSCKCSLVCSFSGQSHDIYIAVAPMTCQHDIR